MRKLARITALSLVALIGLVPIQATPAAAFVGTLDVEPELGGVRITGSFHRLTATVTDPEAPDDTIVAFDTDDNPTTAAETCETDGGTCQLAISSSTAEVQTIRAYVQDHDPATFPPTHTPCGLPELPGLEPDCDADETQEEADDDDTDVVEVEWADGVLDVEPEGSAAAPGEEVEVTATVMSTEETPRGLLANVDAEITVGPNENMVADKADFECDTDQNGVCALTYTAGAADGVDEIQSWLDLNDDPDAEPETGDETDPEGDGFEGDASEGPNEEVEPGDEPEGDDGDITDVVEVSVSAGPVLILAPQSATKTVGTQSALTATLTLGGVPDSGEAIAAQVLPGGPNAGATSTCTTGANGQCTLNYTGANPGTDKVRATVDTDKNGLPNEADSTEDVGVAGGTEEPDATALAQVTWTAPEEDNRCENAKKKVKKLKKKVKKAKKAFKKAKASDDDDRIAKKKKKVKKLKKKFKKAKNRKRNACA